MTPDEHQAIQQLVQQDGYWPLPFKHLSYSAAKQASTCPEQFRQRRILGKKERPGAALVVGDAHHKTIETNMRQKTDSHQDLTLDDMKDAYSDAWKTSVEQKGGLFEIAWGDDKPNTLQKTGLELVTEYHKEVAPRIQPIQVEQKITVDIDGLPVPVIGYIDLETDNVIVENKTAKAAKKRPDNDWLMQARVYQKAVNKPVSWTVAAKLKTPRVLTPIDHPELQLPYQRTNLVDNWFRSVATQLVFYYTYYGPDNPWPGAITHSWACGYCGYRPTCHWWAHERKAA
jgi:hypothetical protein